MVIKKEVKILIRDVVESTGVGAFIKTRMAWPWFVCRGQLGKVLLKRMASYLQTTPAVVASSPTRNRTK